MGLGELPSGSVCVAWPSEGRQAGRSGKGEGGLYTALHMLTPEQRAGFMELPPSRRLSYLVRCARQLGCQGLHIGPELPPPAAPSVLGELKPSVHAGGVFNAASAEPAEVQHVIQNALDFARRIGARDVSFHAPQEPDEPSGKAGARGKDILSEALKQVLPAAQRLDLRLSLETCCGPPFVFADFAEVLCYCQSFPELGLLLDASYLHYAGGDAAAAAAGAKDRLWGVHVSDAIPGGDYLSHTHMPLTHGSLDLAAFIGALREVGYDSFVALEVKGSTQEIRSSLQQLQSLLA